MAHLKKFCRAIVKDWDMIPLSMFLMVNFLVITDDPESIRSLRIFAFLACCYSILATMEVRRLRREIKGG